MVSAVVAFLFPESTDPKERTFPDDLQSFVPTTFKEAWD